MLGHFRRLYIQYLKVVSLIWGLKGCQDEEDGSRKLTAVAATRCILRTDHHRMHSTSTRAAVLYHSRYRDKGNQKFSDA